MSVARIVVSVLVFTAILGLGHFYIWHRTARAPEVSLSLRRWAALLLSALALSLPTVFVLARKLPPEQMRPLAFLAFLWLGMGSTYLSLFALGDLLRGVVRVAGRFVSSVPVDEERRLFFKRALAGGTVLAGSGMTAVSVQEALGQVTVKRVEVTLSRLRPEFDGFTIAQISDIHIGPTLGRSFLSGIVERVNALRPNLIAITGDLVDGSVAHLGQHVEPLRELRATDGTFFVTGNHEYYSGVDEWVSELDRLGIPTLRNRRVVMRRGAAEFDLAGVTDHKADGFNDAPDYEAALGDRDPSRELILLAHQPAAALPSNRYGVGLQLSGHTHGGQFWPWTWVIYLIQPVVRGLGRVGKTQVYVNTGTGYWGPPLRWNTPPEITEIVLRAPA